MIGRLYQPSRRVCQPVRGPALELAGPQLLLLVIEATGERCSSKDAERDLNRRCLARPIRHLTTSALLQQVQDVLRWHHSPRRAAPERLPEHARKHGWGPLPVCTCRHDHPRHDTASIASPRGARLVGDVQQYRAFQRTAAARRPFLDLYNHRLSLLRADPVRC